MGCEPRADLEGSGAAHGDVHRGLLRQALDALRARDLLAPGTVLLSGTIPMHPGVDQFAAAWRVELGDPATGNVIRCQYAVRRLPEPVA